MALKTWNTTYREMLGRLAFIRNPPDGEALSKRRLSAGALLALRRFTRVCDEHAKDFQEEMRVLQQEAAERGIGVGQAWPTDLEQRQVDLLNTELVMQVSAVPTDVFLEEGNHITLMDLELLEPILVDAD